MDIEKRDESLTPDNVIYAIANVLEEILKETDVLESPMVTLFHTSKKPSISL